MHAHYSSLSDWRNAILPKLRNATMSPSQLKEITLLAYFFWDDDRIDTEFHTIETSFLCAFYTLGMLPSVLVTNRQTEKIEKFCKSYGIEQQIEPSLSDGIEAMCYDCMTRLHRRFQTSHVLIIQNDGIIVNPNIQGFLGYDYVGAPWQKRWMILNKLPYKTFCVGNGGLSIRSKKICKTASLLYKLLIHKKGYQWYKVEDVFYAQIVRIFSFLLFRHMRFPSAETAGLFSLEHPTAFTPQFAPCGFHGEVGFLEYSTRYGLPHKNLLEPILDSH